MKIIFLAFACRPESGSEDAVGWNWILEAAKYYDITVVTKTEFKKDIESKHTNINFLYVDSNEKWHDISIYYEYIMWQKKAYKYLKSINCSAKYDYLWYITFGNIILPAYVYKLNIPIIWGPVGGTDQIVDVFYKKMKFKEKFPVQIVRKLILKTLNINYIFNRMCDKSKIIIVRTKDTVSYIPPQYRYKIITHLETAIDSQDVIKYIENKNIFLNKDKINLVYTGQLIGRKNVSSLIDAFVKSADKNNNLVLNIVGDGPLIDELKEQARRNDKIVFWGRCDRKKTLQILAESDIYVFPSLIDTLTFSLLESMVLAKPIICFDVSGMKIALDDSFARKIPVLNYNQCIDEFARSILELSNEPKNRKKMGECAREYVEKNYNWNEIGKFIHNTISGGNNEV